MTTEQAAVNGISITFEDKGPRDAPVILLVMGLGGQLTLWPDEFVDALNARGFRTIRYDNRDVGLSTRFDAAGVPNLKWMFVKSLLRLPVRSAYTLADMAADGVALLDHLGIARAHIVGVSMGGMISQHIAARYPDRVLSLTSVMSTTGNPRLPRAQKEAMQVLTSRPMSGDPEDLIAYSVRAAKVIGSPGYPPDEERLQRRVRSDFERGWYPQGVARQMAAIVADGDRRPMLKSIGAPTLVIHGEGDPLVPLAGGRDTADNIPGARLLTIPGMGHDLPLGLVDTLADAIAGHAGAVAAA
ncbi:MULTISPECIES: alpha/beta fold hydrolase [Sphingopyxis]|jgi:pimeloyl-ACP methyl ester carboxylesterase|uniref:Pimeloyl-ACP methyl ester carboxylesterase n=1 Tax=Sphingopyxis terrae subsp. ummariensis TaxID=429001 RepID=A0A1Y6ESV2_9SPHN|nr:alpha/beta fold hydrolase [Sphingopyxis terrae]PCF92046.1 alpha/beta hydrolase [Sphingopyxis terrae subsp. ummariensis]SMQ65319.1 Pimeloyl-ACP methyl ester carboxylesterase [Sphingopyxis terrae subsp. ummariensis]